MERIIKRLPDLLALSEEQRARLSSVLQGFNLSYPDGFAEDEAEEIAVVAGVDVQAVAAAVPLLGYLGQGGVEGHARLIEARPEGVAPDQVRALLEAFEPAAAHMVRQLKRLHEIALVMPTLRDTSIGCDLRYLRGEEREADRFEPVAIVRLSLDEGEDRVFQCHKQGLRRLIRRLEAAASTLEQLSNQVSGAGAVDPLGGGKR